MKLSIITVCKNAQNTIEQTIQSVISQTYYSNIEYIIIDGKSTDLTLEIINKYIDKIACCISEPDSGTYSAMNKGIQKATGYYCLFLNAGDFLYDNKVIEQVFTLAPDCDFIYGDALYVSDNEIFLAKYSDNLSYYFLYSNTICHQAQFIKRSLFFQHGLYDEKYKINADYDFLVRIVVKYNVSTYHAPHIICIFNTIGQTCAESREFLISERKSVQKTYFSTKVLELLEEHNQLVNLDTVKLSKKLTEFSIIRVLGNLFLLILKLIYKKIYWPIKELDVLEDHPQLVNYSHTSDLLRKRSSPINKIGKMFLRGLKRIYIYR